MDNKFEPVISMLRTTHQTMFKTERPRKLGMSVPKTGMPHIIISLTLLSLLLLQSQTVDALTCSTCDVQKCPKKLDCSGGTTLNVCGCCLECARVVNETCGGPYFMNGKCDAGLVCIIIPAEGQTVSGEEVGICKEIPKSVFSSPKKSASCDEIVCPDTKSMDSRTSGKNMNLSKESSLHCPNDSVLVSTKKRSPDSECCPTTESYTSPGSRTQSCECHPCFSWSAGDEEKEDEGSEGEDLSTPCDPGYTRILKSEGLGVPGQCCDVFECVAQGILCERVECDEDLMFPPVCPDDSYLLAPIVTQEGCCFVQQGCSCLSKDNCPEVECSDGQKKRIKRRGTGLPGACCDEFDCMSDSNPTCLQNGTVYNDGDTWQSDTCTTCECRGSLTFCQPLRCPEVPGCGWMGTLEGQCCPVCKGCVSQTGESYTNGSVWKQDSCVTCHCSSGQVYCQAEMCSPGCVNPWIVPGECCPVCDENPEPTLPLHCPGLVNCTLMCLNGYSLDGNGCYQCQCVNYDAENFECGLDCSAGYLMDLNGRPACACKEDDEKSSQLRTLYSTSSTSLGLLHLPRDPDEGKSSQITITPITTSAIQSDISQTPSNSNSSTSPYVGVADLPNESRLLLSKSTDVTPASRESTVVTQTARESNDPTTDHMTPCPPMLGCTRQCSYGYKLDDYGCPLCRCYKCPPLECNKKCLLGYAVNENGCTLCRCLDSTSVDTTLSPAVIPMLPPLGGRHCSVMEGQRVNEGQSWWDGCRKCFCHEGHEMCALITCPTLRCSNPVMRVGSCCLSCPGDEAGPVGPLGTSACYSADGRYFVEGETWLLDECTQCICHQGAALCAIDSCPPVLCNHPVVLPHTCCPVCPGQILSTPPWRDPQRRFCRSSSGLYYGSGDTWRVNDCQSCVCRDGQIHCFAQTCPVLPCTKYIQKKGQCCPICIDARERSCEYAGETYSLNESWRVDECTTCRCVEGGQVLCRVHVCEEAAGGCDLVHLTGQCCPVCKDDIAVNGTLGRQNLTYSHLDIAFNPAVLTLIIVVILLFVVIIFLLARRRHRFKHYWMTGAATGGITSGSYSVSKSKHQYDMAAVPGAALPCGGFDGCYTADDSPCLTGVRDLKRNFACHNDYSANTYSSATGSTRFSASVDGSLKRPDSPTPSSLCDVIVKDDLEMDDDEESCKKSKDILEELSNDAEFTENKEYFPTENLQFSDKTEREISSSRSTVDFNSGPHDNDIDSDEANDSAVDSCFESSKQLIEKKRRSAGDELERQTARRSLLSPLGSEKQRVDNTGASNINRRSW